CFPPTPPTALYTLSLHDALPISARGERRRGKEFLRRQSRHCGGAGLEHGATRDAGPMLCVPHRAFLLESASSMARCSRSRVPLRDRKSTRLNSSHLVISYAVFCL